MLVKAEVKWNRQKEIIETFGWNKALESGLVAKHYSYSKDFFKEYGGKEEYLSTPIKEIYENNPKHVYFPSNQWLLLSPKEAIERTEIFGKLKPMKLPERFLSIDDIEKIAGQGQQKHTKEHLNKKVDVHVPNNLLFNITEVLVRKDCCTDTLQDDLDSGWRIIAICPQPDQRRPDYIIGKITEEE